MGKQGLKITNAKFKRMATSEDKMGKREEEVCRVF
jgi:hypothetical protein